MCIIQLTTLKYPSTPNSHASFHSQLSCIIPLTTLVDHSVHNSGGSFCSRLLWIIPLTTLVDHSAYNSRGSFRSQLSWIIPLTTIMEPPADFLEECIFCKLTFSRETCFILTTVRSMCLVSIPVVLSYSRYGKHYRIIDDRIEKSIKERRIRHNLGRGRASTTLAHPQTTPIPHAWPGMGYMWSLGAAGPVQQPEQIILW